MMELNEAAARDAKNVCAALGDALLPQLIDIVIEYRWIDVKVVEESADGGDGEYDDMYFDSDGPGLFEFVMDRGIVDHIECGFISMCQRFRPEDDNPISRYSGQIVALAKNGWYDAIEVFVCRDIEKDFELAPIILPAIMQYPPGDEKRYADMLSDVILAKMFHMHYEEEDETLLCDALAKGMTLLPASCRDKTVDILRVFDNLHDTCFYPKVFADEFARRR